MQETTYRRPAAVVLLLATLTLTAAGCDRRASDPTLPSSTPGTTQPTLPSTSPSTTGSGPGGSASAPNR